LARLIPLLLLIVALLVVFFARQQSSRPRSDHTYRPRAAPWRRGGTAAGGSAAHPAGGSNWLVSRAELEGVRDAYSSAALDPSAPLYCCAGCQAYYHQDSVDALAANNRGRCALCGGGDLRAVRVV
jgi:hypothetical protein